MSRVSYLRRVFAAYLTNRKSQLTFWHGEPQISDNFEPGKLGEYYMLFAVKANYSGQYDDEGIPLLDYHGTVGLQYNPIAIAQYGLGNYNLYSRTRDKDRKRKFLKVADWLVRNLEKTPKKTKVWYHHFDWDYRDKLKAPWYSALAQGQGVSVLVRAHEETGNSGYLDSAKAALETFDLDVKNGGVTYTDKKGYCWYEEAIVDPPTHILNGFIWGAWGLYDFFLHTGDRRAEKLWLEAVNTLRNNLHAFDAGFWSLYEQSGTRMKMLASPFYHSLHIIQLRVMHKITGDSFFGKFAEKWNRYRKSAIKRYYALLYKSAFKLFYY
jgi:hypothetical protein